ncbi:MAG TPA: hypothetical protein VGR89_02855 [Puia sp.]|nr:hypothetical protein [Puia sp.]
MDFFYKLSGGWWLIIDEIGDYDVVAISQFAGDAAGAFSDI